MSSARRLQARESRGVVEMVAPECESLTAEVHCCSATVDYPQLDRKTWQSVIPARRRRQRNSFE